MFNMFIILMLILTFMIDNFFMIWMNLEISTMVFIFMISKNSWFNSVIMYFIIHAMSSNFIIFTLSSMNLINYNNNWYMTLIIMFNLTMLLKIGMFPFHQWFISMSKYMEWMNFFMLSTILKIIPMYMIMEKMYNKIIITSSIISSMLSSWMSISQTNFKKLMSYSSINHTSWLMIMSLINYNIWMIYLIIYTLLTFMIMKINSYFNINWIKDINKIKYKNINNFLFMIMLTNSSLPPFTSFMSKWFSMENMFMNKMFLSLSILIVSSVMIMYSYMRIFMILTMNFFSINNINQKKFFNKNILMNFNHLMIFYFSMFMLMIIPFNMNL